MPQPLFNYALHIEQKLYEQETPKGELAVYQTKPLGKLLTLNDEVVLSEADSFLYHEMLAHPILFTHIHPKRVAILGHQAGTLTEVLKHTAVDEVVCVSDNTYLKDAIAQHFPDFHPEVADPRVSYQVAPPLEWLANVAPQSFDVIIETTLTNHELQAHYQDYYQALQADGLLIHPCKDSILQLNSLARSLPLLLQAGFQEKQPLSFPQQSYPGGFRTLLMVTKHPIFKRIREKDIFNRTFTTRYYNFDTHRASLAVPEEVRKLL